LDGKFAKKVVRKAGLRSKAEAETFVAKVMDRKAGAHSHILGQPSGIHQCAADSHFDMGARLAARGAAGPEGLLHLRILHAHLPSALLSEGIQGSRNDPDGLPSPSFVKKVIDCKAEAETCVL
jgi:hypothetical protein